MLQVRKLVLAVAAVTAFTSSYAHALGLGDIAVKSSLNQPLEAEISLLEVRDLSSAELKSRLASPEEFSKAGVDRQFFLTGLTFTPMISSSGKNVIRVTSKQPVKEPYLNFLVEVIWPSGRLLREYTLLLDPPLYAPQRVIYAPELAVTPAAATIQPATQVSRQAAPAASRATTAWAPRAAQGGEYRVQRNDTLWEIASQIKGTGSVHQAMLAIQDLNPNAFVNGNINRIKSGQVLRLPDAQDINRRSHNQAVAQVNQQNQNWRTPALAERQVDATRRIEAGAAPSAIEKKDSLRLVSDTTGQAQQAADQGTEAEMRVLQDKLARSEEFLDSTLLEKEELKGHVEDLSSQLEKLQRLIELKDSQLAQLQNADETLTELPTKEMLLTAESLSSDAGDNASAEELSATLGDPAVAQLEGLQFAEETDLDLGGDAASETAESRAVSPDFTVEPANAEPAPTAEQPVAVIPEPTVQEKNLFEKILDNPTLLAATGGSAILALLFLLMGLSRSRARKEAEQQIADSIASSKPVQAESPVFEVEQVTPVDLAAFDEEVTPQQEIDPLAGFDAAEPVVQTQMKEEVFDPLVEANSYLGFGRLNQAIAVLSKALEAEPERLDIRHKLLEVYAELEDQAGFTQQLNELIEMGGAEAELAQLKTRHPEMFAVEQVLAPTLDHELAELDLELELDEDKLEEPAETSSVVSELDAELDELSAFLDGAAFEVETETSTEQDELTLEGLESLEGLEEQAPKDTDLDLGFDLDLDLSESAAAATDELQTEKTAEGLDELDLHLDSLDLDLATIEPLEQPSESAAAHTVAGEFSLDELSRNLEEAIQADQSAGDTDEAFSFEVLEPDTQKQDLAEFDLQLDDLNLEQDPLAEHLSTEESDQSIRPETALNSALEDSTAQAETEPLADFADLGDLESLDSIDDDFSFLSGTDETATKLDLARAYIDMGDAEGARDILDEVIAEGTAAQQDEARELSKQLG